MRTRFQARLKTKKCRNGKCKKEFVPNTEWQKFCSIPCRTATTNRRYAALIRKGRLRDLERQSAAAEPPPTEQGAV